MSDQTQQIKLSPARCASFGECVTDLTNQIIEDIETSGALAILKGLLGSVQGLYAKNKRKTYYSGVQLTR